MKNRLNLYKSTLALLGLVLLAVSVMSLAFPEIGFAEFLGLGTSGGSMVLANIPVVGTPTLESTEANAAGHLKRSISQVVTEIKPDEFPLDTMMRTIRKSEKVENVKVEYETVKYRERGDTTTAEFTAAGDATDEDATLDVGKVNIWGVDDTIYVPSVSGLGGKELRLKITSINRSGNTINVTALNSPTADTQRVPTIATATPIYRMAPAKSELDSTSDIITQLPSPDFNYCQINMCYLEEGVVNSLHKAYSGYSHRDKQLQELYNMRSSTESANLFGIKSKTADPTDNEYNYTSDGIIAKVATNKNFGTGGGAVDPDLADVLDLLEQTFSGNAGSEERVLFAGKKLITGLQKISFNKEQLAQQIAMYHGVNVSRLESNFGVLNIKHSKMLDQMGWQNNGVALDLEHIYKHDLEPMKSEKLDPDKAGTRRVKNAVRILENSCLTIRYESDVHLTWKPTA